jgi:hypothetical protein
MRLSISLWLAAACLVFATTVGCERTVVSKSEEHATVGTEPHFEGQEPPPAVLFDIKLSSDPADAAHFQSYDCTYQARGKTAKFRISFKEVHPVSGGFPKAFMKGEFLSVAGSDNSALLQDLKVALDAKKLPRKSPRTPALFFSATVLGENQSRSPSGGFTDKPTGDWTAIKITLPRDGDEGEVFLNLNRALGKGEFSLKDSDYGDYLLKELGKVL